MTVPPDTLTPDATRHGATVLVEQCAAVAAGEKVLVLADARTETVAALVADVAGAHTTECVSRTIPELAMHGAEPPADIAERMAWADVIFCLTSCSLAHSTARRRATDGGTRYLSLPDYSLELLASPSLAIDFESIVPEANRLAAILDGARHVRIRSERGTDLTLNVTGRTANNCPGLVRRPGMLGSPPDAEVNIAPIEHASEGIIWIDGSIPAPGLGRLDTPVGLTLHNGCVVQLDGPASVVDRLEEMWDGGPSDPAAPTAPRVLGEFGIGLNPAAELTGRMLEDEGCADTVHFGFGSNVTIGGTNAADLHLDFVMRAPHIEIDGVHVVPESSRASR